MRTERNQADNHAVSPTRPTSLVLPVITAAIAIGVFILDTITYSEIAVAVLYVGVVLLAARFLEKRGVVLMSLGCMALAVLSFSLSQHEASPAAALLNRFLSLVAIGGTAFLAVQSQSREMVSREQASLLDLTHDTIFVRDLNSVITFWNRGAEELYGWKREEAVGKTTHQLLQTIFPKPLEEIMEEVQRTGRWEGELVHTKNDGMQVIVTSRWSAQRDARGRHVGILETNNDITERKRAEEALRQAQAELAHVTRVTTLGELTTSIAHEVSQPIAGAVTSGHAALRWLARETPDLEAARRAIERAIRDVNRASAVIGRIRELIKKAPPRKDRCDLNEVIGEVVLLTRSEVLRHGVSLHTQLAIGLPAVQGDRVQLQQVILNLVLNAVEAMSGTPEGEREVLISTQTHAANSVLVAVRDSGPGLSAENLPRLFEPFYTSKPTGLGMGLSICRSIIEAHEGRLWAAGSEPRGALFQFTIPIGEGTDRNQLDVSLDTALN